MYKKTLMFKPYNKQDFLQGQDFCEKMAEIMHKAESEMAQLFAYFPEEKLDKYLFQLSNNHINSKIKELKK